MTNHTPGPWIILIEGTCSGAWPFIVPEGTHVDDCGEEAIAELPTTHVERDTKGFPGTYSEKPERFEECEDHDRIMANARLIAAAPELYKALRRLEHFGHTQATWEFAKAAMAKAVQP